MKCLFIMKITLSYQILNKNCIIYIIICDNIIKCEIISLFVMSLL